MHPPKHPWIHPYCLLNIDKLRRVLVLKIFTAVLSTVVHKAKGGGASAPLAPPPLVAPMQESNVSYVIKLRFLQICSL